MNMAGAALLSASLLCNAAASGQQNLPQFEAASVKPSAPGDMRGTTYGFTAGGGCRVRNGTLKGMIESAYDVRDFRISGGAGWMDSEGYDVDAVTPPRWSSAIPEDRAKETRVRVQTLLAERFQLAVRKETKELPVCLLTLGKGGSKLVEAPAEPSAQGMGIRSECSRMTGTRATMANLAFGLPRQLRRPVQDQTGLDGRYDFTLEFAPDTGPCAMAANADSTDAPSIFMAIEEQLGLRLEPAKGPDEVIVIDHAVKADPN